MHIILSSLTTHRDIAGSSNSEDAVLTKSSICHNNLLIWMQSSYYLEYENN